MAPMWWNNDVDERYWMEITDREDLGGYLENWAEKEAGGRIAPTWLLDDMRIGNVVFHYDKRPKTKAIVGYSQVAPGSSDHWTDDEGRPMIGREIRGYTELDAPITLTAIRSQSAKLLTIIRAIKDRGKAPHHLAIIDSNGRAELPTAYIARFPARSSKS